MRIWRVEHKKTGRGPYIAGAASYLRNKTEIDLYHPVDVRPGPTSDDILMQKWRGDRHGYTAWRFGFSNIRQARVWFGLFPVVDYLTKEGFCLKRVEVPDDFVLVGAKQVCYDSNVAVGLYKRPLHYLLKGFVC